MKRWLITGSSGLLGSNLGRWLAGRVHTTGISRHPWGTRDLFDDWGQHDLTHGAPLLDLYQPDVVVHCGALTSIKACEDDPALAQAVNVDATAWLARAAQAIGARFVYISTDAVFSGPRGGHTEQDVPAPANVYGRTKLNGERAALALTDALVLRVNHFGWSPSGQRSILEFFVNALRAGEQVNGYTDYQVSTGYVGTICDAAWRLVEADATGVYHVTAADALTKYDFGLAVAEQFGLDGALIHPTRVSPRPDTHVNLGLNCSKAQAILGDLPTQRAGIALAYADQLVSP